MCLTTTQNKLKFAKEDIVCYKYLQWNYRTNSFVTPCIETPILNIKIILGLKPFRAKGRVERYYGKSIDGGFINYYGGLIHAYATTFTNIHNENFFLFKCHIPKRTRYVEGNDGTIAAKKIIFDELIDAPYSFHNLKNYIQSLKN